MSHRRIDHFKHARLAFAAIAAVRQLPPTARLEALQEITPYKSRGKGRGTPARNWMRPYCNNAHGRPRDGTQEIARRLRQIRNYQLTKSNGLFPAVLRKNGIFPA